MRLAIIPARGGSKRIPRKNIRLFSGRPMLDYAVSIARDSGLFDEIVVSSEDNEVLELAEACGARPSVRPMQLADDFTPTVPVIAHCIEQFTRSFGTPEVVCCIYPCVPLLLAQDISSALELLLEGPEDYCFPVVAFPAAVQRSLRLDQHHRLSPIFPEHSLIRTQDIEVAYYDAGQFYWGRTEAWLAQKPIHTNARGLPIPSWRMVDFDTLEDWQRGEVLFQLVKSLPPRTH